MGGVSKETVSAFGHKIKKSDLFKLVGLVCFIALVFGIVAALWPSLSLIFEPDGLDQMIESIQSQGPVGVLILLGLQLLQIIVAFIPGEVVQVAAGMLYSARLSFCLAASFPVRLFTRWFTSWEPPSFGPWWTKSTW